jgi:hypothetical protein
MDIQHPFEHICQLVLVHCVAPLVEQGAEQVAPATAAGDAGAGAVVAAGLATGADEGALVEPCANWPPGLEELPAGAAEALGDAAGAAAGELPELLEPEPAAGWPGTAAVLLPPKMDMDALRSAKLPH